MCKNLVRSTYLVILFFITLLPSLPATCQPEGVPSVAFLDRVSDAIIVGRATLVPSSGALVTVQLEIDRVIKGALSANSEVDVTYLDSAPGCSVRLHPVPVYGIWFLQKNSDGSYRFADNLESQRCHPFESQYEMPDNAPSSSWRYPQTARSTDKLAYELAWSIASHHGDGPVALIRNPLLLYGASDKVATDIYQKLYLSSDPETRFIGEIGLIRQGNPNALENLMSSSSLHGIEKAVARTSYSQNGQSLPISQITNVGNPVTQDIIVARSIAAIVNPSDNTVNQLGILVQTSAASTPLIRAAATALSNIHSARSISYLAPLLYSNDKYLRASAIGGIACFANGVPIIDPKKPHGGLDLNRSSPFKNIETIDHFAKGMMTISKNEQYYLNYWRGWWIQNEGAVMSSAVAAGPTN